MPITSFGPRTQRVYAALRDRIVRGELAVGDKLLPHIALAAEYGVAPLTMRQVLARLEEEGFILREHGRGTFVRPQLPPAVLIAAADTALGVLLVDYVTRAGYRPIAATSPAEARAYLEQDPSISLVFSDSQLPDKESGIDLIRAVRRRWPELALAVVTGHVGDLAELLGTPEWPILILSKPFWPHQIEETLHLALR